MLEPLAAANADARPRAVIPARSIRLLHKDVPHTRTVNSFLPHISSESKVLFFGR